MALQIVEAVTLPKVRLYLVDKIFDSSIAKKSSLLIFLCLLIEQ
jgi:hypothetical protein